jgi:hypothetical protein
MAVTIAIMGTGALAAYWMMVRGGEAAESH